MIDYIALAIGHGLLALALLRLVMREDVDTDPAIAALQEEAESVRAEGSVSGRNAKRRAQAGQDEA